MDDEAGTQAATEASLELEHRLLKAHIAEMYVLFDNDRRILEVNRNACEFFQRSEDQLVGKRLSEVFPQLNWTPLFQRLKRTLDTGETDHFETESIVHPGRFNAFTIYPHPRGATAIMLNVTEKRQLACQLSHLTALSRAAEQIGSVGTLLLDHHARIVSFCGAFEEWTGFAEKELLQRHVSTVVDRTSQAAIADAAIAAMETRRVTTAEVSFLSKSLETIRARVAIAPIIEGFAATGVTIVATKASPN